MARSRNIKPGASKNEALAELGPMTQFLFVMLPTLADKEGRMEDRPKRIKAEVFPYYEADVDAMLQSLMDSPERFVVRYEVNGSRYLQITKFHEHQTPHHKEIASKIPPIPIVEATKKQRKAKHEPSLPQAPVKGISKEESELKESGIRNQGDPEKVVEHYRTYHPKSQAGDKELDKIRARLKDGFSVEDLCLAIDGCHASPFHNGENDDGRKYQNLELIVRDSSKVTQFLELAGKEGGPALSAKSRKNLTVIEQWMAKKNGDTNGVQ
jgi:hypothetical protein